MYNGFEKAALRITETDIMTTIIMLSMQITRFRGISNVWVQGICLTPNTSVIGSTLNRNL